MKASEPAGNGRSGATEDLTIAVCEKNKDSLKFQALEA